MTVVQSRSPQRPDTIVIEVEQVPPERVAALADRARTAQREWSALPPVTRADRLAATAEAIASAHDELADLMVREVGKTRAESAGEVERAARIMRYYAQQVLTPEGELLPSSGPPTSLLMSVRRPRGVAGLITPWNFPIAIPLWKAGAALAWGNAVLLKPAPAATAMAVRVAELFAPILPPDLFQVVPGDADTGAALVEASDVVSFTGSVAVGKAVALAATRVGLPVQSEMGGQNASVILADAELESAAATVAGAAMEYAGQKCTATSRVVVVGDPAPFTEALVEAVRSLPLGDPADPGVVVGPVISEAARRHVVDAVKRARAHGARALTGGVPAEPGWTVAPAVVDGLGPEAELAQHEVFGPLCVVLSASDEGHALEIVNGTSYGLSAALFTRDLDRALALAPRLDVGMVKINSRTTGADFYAPFGGERDSGYGPREMGTAARELYTSLHTVSVFPAGGGV